jgi:hypothetical protein
MIRSRRLSRILPSLLAGTVAVLMLAKVLSQWQYVGAPVATPVPPAASGAAELPPSQALGTISLDPAKEAVVLDRPLFSPTRRPPPAPAAAAAGDSGETKPSAPEPPPLNFALVGIVRDRVSSLALIRPPDGKPVLSLREGQTLDGWTLVSIGVDSASFRNGAAARELVLDFRHAAPAPSQ